MLVFILFETMWSSIVASSSFRLSSFEACMNFRIVHHDLRHCFHQAMMIIFANFSIFSGKRLIELFTHPLSQALFLWLHRYSHSVGVSSPSPSRTVVLYVWLSCVQAIEALILAALITFDKDLEPFCLPFGIVWMPGFHCYLLEPSPCAQNMCCLPSRNKQGIGLWS